MAWPYLALLALNVLGLALAVPRYLIWNVNHPGTVVLNAVWTLYNIIILSVATAVALETQQRRTSVRLGIETPFMMLCDDGHVVAGNTIDISMSGAQVRLAQPCSLRSTDLIRFALTSSTADCLFTGTVVENDGVNLRVAFDELTLEQETLLTRLVYSRADSWLDWRSTRNRDRPLQSLFLIVRVAFHGFALALRLLLPKTRRRDIAGEDEFGLAGKIKISSSGLRVPVLAFLLFLLLVPGLRSQARTVAPKRTCAVPHPPLKVSQKRCSCLRLLSRGTLLFTRSPPRSISHSALC